MKKFNLKSLLMAIVVMGVILTVGHGFTQPQAVLSAQAGESNFTASQNYYRWYGMPQRYIRSQGYCYNNLWQQNWKPAPEVEAPEVEAPEVERPEEPMPEQPEPEQPMPEQPMPEQPEPEQPKPEEVTPVVPETPAPEVNQPELSYEQNRMLQLVNEERVKAGASPLTLDTELSKVAYIKAKDMVDNNYFSHESPTYGSPFNMMKDFGIRYSAAGENLAGYNSVDKAHVGLMNSDGHRKNILNSNYTHIGIGVHKSPKYGYVFVQMFIRK